MRRWRRCGVKLVVLLASLLQLGMPVFSPARMAQESLLAQVICSPSGTIRRVVVDADGGIREAGGSAAHEEHCPLCSAGGALVATKAPAEPKPAGIAPALRRGATWGPRDGAALTPPATGPPLST